jgi:hypothetical protein
VKLTRQTSRCRMAPRGVAPATPGLADGSLKTPISINSPGGVLSQSRVRTSAKRWLACAAVGALVFVCSCTATERAEKAGAMEAGTTAEALVSEAGSPTLERRVDKGNLVDPCVRDERNVRAFEYHIPIDPVTGPIRRLLHRPAIAAKTLVCLDDGGLVTSTHFLKY